MSTFLFHLLLSSPLVVTSVDWGNLHIPNLELTLNYTTSAYERNFSKYFHENTMSLNTALFTFDPSSSTLSIQEEMPVLEKFRNETQLAHCIFDDLFDMHTFRMKRQVENQFLQQLTDMCVLRVEETDSLFVSEVPDSQKRERYEQIKRVCDLAIEEYSIRVLKTYKEEVKLAASHHYDLRPQDPARLKYEERIDSHFTRLGFEFLPIVEKYFQQCSDKYFQYFRELPLCDKNLDEEDKRAFHEKVDATGM